MCLLPQAFKDLEAVEDKPTAMQFLKNYGSHVSDGIHHAGEILSHGVEVSTEREARWSELEQTAAQELKVGASFGSWWSALSFSTQNEFSSSSAMIQSSNQTSTKAMVRFRADSLGPTTFNAELFKQILLAHKETWHIIDRGDTKNLVPVWEILLRRYPEKQRAAELLP